MALKAHTFLLMVLVPLGGACVKQVPSPERADEEWLSRYSAQLESIGSRLASATACQDVCGLSKEGCEVSRNLCELATRRTGREDFQQTCVGSQGRCAQFNDRCSGCQG